MTINDENKAKLELELNLCHDLKISENDTFYSGRKIQIKIRITDYAL